MRYFIETSYKGTAYSGFQIQKNAVTIQSEVEKALSIFFKQPFSLTGSSRTDAGVHALQNFFHFDTAEPLLESENFHKSQLSKVPSPGGDLGEAGFIYNLNAILPRDIVIKRILPVGDNAHCRFDALSREYKYFIYRDKNPFLQGSAYYYPYLLDKGKLEEVSELILANKDFTSFSKRNTQVKNFICNIKKSKWTEENGMLIYQVEANRFLRGMVKGLVGTMLRVGVHKISPEQFEEIIISKDCTNTNFSVPSFGLFLIAVNF